MRINEQLTAFGSNAILGLLTVGLVLAIGSSVMHSTKTATIVPTKVASR